MSWWKRKRRRELTDDQRSAQGLLRAGLQLMQGDTDTAIRMAHEALGGTPDELECPHRRQLVEDGHVTCRDCGLDLS